MSNSKRYIPVDSIETINEDAKAVVYTYDNSGPCACGYSGKRKNSDFQYRFKTEDARDEYIANYFKGKIEVIASNELYKKEKKERETKEFATLAIDDIFVCSWGYEQTNVTVVQLVALKGKTGTFRPIRYESIEELSWASEHVRVVPNSFHGEEFKKRLKGSSFKQSSFQYFSKVEDPENEKFYHSWYA